MADQFDRAQDENERMTGFYIHQQQTKAASEPKLAAIGECLNTACGEPFDGEPIGRLFCNSGCAKEHAKRSK